MFKAARWRSEKNKIKAVFKLQFRATQVLQSEWDVITVSLVPLDVGKPTVASEKTAVIDGNCHWENPVYETVKLVQDPKTGRINEKIYHFLVSATGLSQSGVLGETTFDFAAYHDAVKPFTASLPLKASKSGAILHVTVQRMQDDVNGREAEETGDKMVKPNRRTLKSQLSNCDTEEAENASNGNSGSEFTEDAMKFPSSKATPLLSESNGNIQKSCNPDAIPASGSDSSSGRDTPKENKLKSNIHEESANFLSPLSKDDIPETPPTTKAATLVTDNGDHRRSNTEWSDSSAPDGSTDGSTNSSEESGLGERLQTSDVSHDKLRNEVVILARRVEVSELELQALRKQVVKEKKQGQDLSNELCGLKEERDALRKECEQFKKKRVVDERVSNRSQFDGEDLRSTLEEIRQELNHEKNLNANLRVQLQKTQDSNSELILAVNDLEDLLEQKNIETSCVNCNSAAIKSAPNANGNCRLEEDEEQYALEVLVKESDGIKVAYSHEQEIADLTSEIELYKKDREELEMQMEQLALDYEILKQEHHDMTSKLEQVQLREQLRMQYECSAHLSIINDLDDHVESLEKELEKQAESFEADLALITHAKVEQEQRAIQAEEALRKTRWNNAKVSKRLQDDFERLSVQMSSTFDANEKLTVQALTDARDLRLQKNHLEELLEKANKELELMQDQCKSKLQELASQIDFKTKQTDQLLLRIKDKSEELENQKEYEEARYKALSEEMSKLKVEMQIHLREKSSLLEQIEQKEAEMDQLKTSNKETETLLQDKDLEKDVLQRDLTAAREDLKKLQEGLNGLWLAKDEKETLIRTLNSELTTLKVQYDDLKHSLFEDELEKENLRKQVFQLRGDIRKKEDAITSMEKKLKETNARVAVSEGTSKITARIRNNKSNPAGHGSKEVANLHEKIKLLEGDIKSKDAALEGSKHSFFKKEKDLSKTIEELEKAMEELRQKGSPVFSEDEIQKEAKAVEKNIKCVNTNCKRNKEENLLQPEMGDTVCTCATNGIDKPVFSNIGANSKINEEVLTGYTCGQGDLAEIQNKMAALKERNESMEAELKEMQERYSEISLKFAEVEGERQQLVMTIRALKNAQKN